MGKTYKDKKRLSLEKKFKDSSKKKTNKNYVEGKGKHRFLYRGDKEIE